MQDINFTRDVIRRRFRFHFKSDPVKDVYCDVLEDSVLLTFILCRNLSDQDRATIEAKYLRIMQDIPSHKVTVLNSTNHWHRKPDTYTVWSKKGGFV